MCVVSTKSTLTSQRQKLVNQIRYYCMFSFLMLSLTLNKDREDENYLATQSSQQGSTGGLDGKSILAVLMANSFGQNAYSFRNPAEFYSYHFLTSIFSPTKRITYIQARSSAGYGTVLVSCLTLSSLTTIRFLSRRDSPTHHVNLYNSVSLVPISSTNLIFWWSPQMSHKGTHSASKRRSTCSLNTPGLTIVPSCTDGPILWPVLFGPKLGAEEGQMTSPLVLDHSAFILVFQLVMDGLLMFLCFHPPGVLSVFREPYSKVKGYNATLLP